MNRLGQDHHPKRVELAHRFILELQPIHDWQSAETCSLSLPFIKIEQPSRKPANDVCPRQGRLEANSLCLQLAHVPHLPGQT